MDIITVLEIFVVGAVCGFVLAKFLDKDDKDDKDEKDDKDKDGDDSDD